MALVGDIIMSGRESIPDMPQILPPPALGSVTAAAGGSLPTLTYYVVLTYLTPWGETLPSSEATATLVSGQGSLVVNWGSSALGGMPLALRIYFGWVGSGQEDNYVEFPNVNIYGSPVVIDGSIPTNRGIPPSRSSAYLPDTDGPFINAFTMFRWLNEGLNILSRKVGGIQDATGCRTVVGQPHYRLTQRWIRLTNIWFDGWELFKGRRADIFYRNAITAIGALSVTLRQAETSLVEVFPQPNRTGGASLTTSFIGPSDTSFTVDTAVSWLLPFGLARLSQPATNVTAGGSEEIIAYASARAGTFTGVIRSLGGTYAKGIYEPAGTGNVGVGWPIGSLVEELNLRIAGYRMANTYLPGMANVPLYLPDGWADVLPVYLEAKALSTQGDKGGAERAMKLFTSMGQELASANKPPLQGPIQIGANPTNEIYNPGLGGGWYLP